MVEVRDAADARAGFQGLSLAMQARAQGVYQRLTRWPDVSGAKPLHGAYRVRTGEYRVLFRVDVAANRIVVFRIAHRRDLYQ